MTERDELVQRKKIAKLSSICAFFQIKTKKSIRHKGEFKVIERSYKQISSRKIEEKKVSL